MSRFKILQIIPATPGWWIEHLPETGNASMMGAVAFWALVQDNTEDRQYVIGIDPAWIKAGTHGTATGNGGMLIEIPDEPEQAGDGYAFNTDAEQMMAKNGPL
jgi:hypothetical protein